MMNISEEYGLEFDKNKFGAIEYNVNEHKNAQ